MCLLFLRSSDLPALNFRGRKSAELFAIPGASRQSVARRSATAGAAVFCAVQRRFHPLPGKWSTLQKAGFAVVREGRGQKCRAAGLLSVRAPLRLLCYVFSGSFSPSPGPLKERKRELKIKNKPGTVSPQRRPGTWRCIDISGPNSRRH